MAKTAAPNTNNLTASVRTETGKGASRRARHCSRRLRCSSERRVPATGLSSSAIGGFCRCNLLFLGGGALALFRLLRLLIVLLTVVALTHDLLQFAK